MGTVTEPVSGSGSCPAWIARVAKPGADEIRRPADAGEREALIRMLEQQMQAAAEELDFELAAVLRDQLLELKADAPLRERAQPVR